MADELHQRRIDILTIGLFGLAVGALTLGVAQLGGIPEQDRVGTLVIALIFGGIVQILAGITDIRYHEQLGGTALTMYGFFWTTVCTAKLVSASINFQIDMVLFAPINWSISSFLRSWCTSPPTGIRRYAPCTSSLPRRSCSPSWHAWTK